MRTNAPGAKPRSEWRSRPRAGDRDSRSNSYSLLENRVWQILSLADFIIAGICENFVERIFPGQLQTCNCALSNELLERGTMVETWEVPLQKKRRQVVDKKSHRIDFVDIYD